MARGVVHMVRATRESAARTRALVIPPVRAPQSPRDGGLRIALLVYRGNPQCGGQGVYTKYISRELVALGHSVEVFSGAPWPELDPEVGFTPVVGLDLYRAPDPFRIPSWREFRSWADVMEFLSVASGSFGEPRAFARRVRGLLASRRGDFDVIHDNQTMGYGIRALVRDGWPLLETVHHPITVDRQIALDHAETRLKRYGVRRWYRFLRMQIRVLRSIPYVLTVSPNSKDDIHAQMGVPLDDIAVVPVGVDVDVFRPRTDVAKQDGRLMVTSSSDVAMKGLVPLLEAVALLRDSRNVSLVVIGTPKAGGTVDRAIDRLGLRDVVTTVSGISDDEMARLYNEAQVVVVPSLYEGFSLPAIEAMACGSPVVGTTGGAIPQVVGDAGMLVEPGNSEALKVAIAALLDDPAQRQVLAFKGRERVLANFTWRVAAEGTAACYHSVITHEPLPLSLDFVSC